MLADSVVPRFLSDEINRRRALGPASGRGGEWSAAADLLALALLGSGVDSSVRNSVGEAWSSAPARRARCGVEALRV